jgi:peptide/nickel transport system ATP-binding protein
MNNNNELLKVENLKITFKQRHGDVTAVDDVSLTINKGRIIGFVGESGCGKSVTSRSFLRIEAPGRIKSGTIEYYPSEHQTIRIDQADPRGAIIRSIRWNDIAMIFQEPMTSLGPMHTIGNQIAEAMTLHLHISKKEAAKQIIEVLLSVGMPRPEQIVDQYPHQLSGGLRQRAMIAMALSCNPKLLIADEPTTALDVTTEAQILALLSERQKALGMAILYISHNLAVISKIAEYVLVMYLGQIVEEAPVDMIFQEPAHPYTRALLASIPQLTSDTKNRLETIKGDIPDPYSRPAGCPFHPRCPQKIGGSCDRVVPAKSQLANGTRVACHLYTSSSKVG